MALEYNLSCIIRKDNTFFPKNTILFFRRSMKDDLSQKKKYMEIWDFLQMFWKNDLSKKSHWNMIFLVVLSRKMIFLFPESMILFFRRQMEDDLSQKIHGNTIFSSNALKTWSFQKSMENERWSFLVNTRSYNIFCI